MPRSGALALAVRVLLQRVSTARVAIGGSTVGQVARGLLVFLAVFPSDSEAEADYLTDKLLNLRIFADEAGKMNLSVRDVGGGVLLVSQFTLAGDARKGRRPSFVAAAPPAQAEQLYEYFLGRLRAHHADVSSGQFGADMQVHLVNDGPVTMLLDWPETAVR